MSELTPEERAQHNLALEHVGRRQAVEEAIQRARRGLPWRSWRTVNDE